MPENVVKISGATEVDFYLGNYSYADIVASMENLKIKIASTLQRVCWKDSAGTTHKLLEDASGASALTQNTVLIVNSSGQATSSAKFTHNLTSGNTAIGGDLAITGDITADNLNIDDWDAAYAHSQVTTGNPHDISFDDLTSTPTTLSGYGITDAYTKTAIDDALALKYDTSNPDGYLTTETDPTVPAHVKSIASGDITEWDAAYAHSQVTTGNPHSVTWGQVGSKPSNLITGTLTSGRMLVATGDHTVGDELEMSIRLGRADTPTLRAIEFGHRALNSYGQDPAFFVRCRGVESLLVSENLIAAYHDLTVGANSISNNGTGGLSFETDGDGLFAQQLGVGGVSPQSKLHVHESDEDTECWIQVTNDLTGSGFAGAGLNIGVKENDLLGDPIVGTSDILAVVKTYNSMSLWLTEGRCEGNEEVIIGGYAAIRAYDNRVGFCNTSPIEKPTVSGSRGGNAALASLLTALENYGLITDSTS